jgi:YidC/Oxa1 family membrane protein insertase
MGWLMGPIYTAISWILLKWHWVWDHILPNGNFLGTTWDWVLAIVFLVITIRIILFPIFVKQIRSQRAMQALQPKLKELQAKHKGDQQTLREEMMKLYQTEKVNPLMGCLPLLLQIPVFLGLFHVLKGLNPLQPAARELYGWTGEQWDSAVVARLFNAPIAAHFSSSPADLASLGANGVVVKIVAAILVIIMMITTFMTSRQMILKTGWSQDPQQRMIQKLMLYGIPFSLLLSGWYFPIGVVIYWVTQNLFSLGQQFWVLHKYPPPVTAGNIPMRGPKATATAADQPGLLARIIQAKPAAPKAPARGGFLGQTPTRSGIFRRRTAAAIEPPAAEPRSLAPRPGAKPVKQSPAVSATPAPLPSDPTAEPAPTNGSPPAPPPAQAKAAPAKSTPAKSTPAKSAPAKANGSGASGGAATGGAPSGGGANGGAANGGAANGGASKATAGAARGKSAAKKVGTRKGQPNRKGGAKR